MKMIWANVAFALTAFLLNLAGPTQHAEATYRYVYNTTITLFAQSTLATGGANWLISSVPFVYNGTTYSAHSACGNNMYIRYEDKAIYATALSAVSSGETVNLIYDDAADYKTIEGHGGFWNCRVVSLWIS